MLNLQALKRGNTNRNRSDSYLFGEFMENQIVPENRRQSPFKIVLQFPSKTLDEDSIKKEIKAIMKSTLLEQLEITS